MNDLTKVFIFSASGFVAFLAIGVGLLIWYNRWNRQNMERQFETDEAFSALVGNPEARLGSGTSGMTSLDGSPPAHPAVGSTSMGRLSHTDTRSQRHRASSTPSLSESAIYDIYQGRRKPTRPTLVEDTDKNNAWFTVGGHWLMSALRRRDSWER